jgi:hypothetical protein
MDELCNTAPHCTRCQDNPRLPGQRWCRVCLTAAQRQRRTARRAAQAETALPGHTAPSPVSPPVTQPSAQGLQGVTHPLTQALQAYRRAQQEYYAVARRPWPLRPPEPSLKVLHWWQRVHLSQQRWLAMCRDSAMQ